MRKGQAIDLMKLYSQGSSNGWNEFLTKCYNEKNIYKEVTKMTVSYKKLWKLLIDRDMKKKDLQAAAGISPSSISKLSKNEYVSMDVLVKVCTALGVDFKDIMELVPNMVEERK